METIKFNSKEHEQFYNEMLSRFRIVQVYHRAFFYCMGACEDTRDHINDLFDFKSGCIRPDNMHQAFQTGSSYRVSRMAFNLWNGFVEEGEEKLTTPSELYACRFGEEFHQAIKLRYPEYYREQSPEVQSVINNLTEMSKTTSGQVGQKSQVAADIKGGER